MISQIDFFNVFDFVNIQKYHIRNMIRKVFLNQEPAVISKFIVLCRIVNISFISLNLIIKRLIVTISRSRYLLVNNGRPARIHSGIYAETSNNIRGGKEKG